MQSCGAYSEHAQTHTGAVADFFHIETPFKVDSSGPSADVENYCSDLTTTCTIKTAACGRGAGIFIPCGNKPYKHTDMQTELQTARNIFIHKHVRRARLADCFPFFFFWFFFGPACLPPKHENKPTINTGLGSISSQIKKRQQQEQQKTQKKLLL